MSLLSTSADIQAAIDRIPDPVRVDVREISGLERATAAVEAVLSDR